MRMWIVTLGLLGLLGCVPSVLVSRAQARLGTNAKHTHLMAFETIAGDEIYVFCRNERSRDVGSPIPWGGRTFDGACVTYVCPANTSPAHCREE